jgi:hypothetical protein
MSSVKLTMAVVTVAACTAASLGAQSAEETKSTKSYTSPKTAWGDHDLQGIWPSTDMVSVPFERPKQFGSRVFLTDQEFAQRQKDAEKQSALDNESFSVDNVKPEVEAMGDIGGVTSPPPFWLERGVPSRQSSLVVDPPDGQLPPMTPDGLRRVALTKNTYLQYVSMRRPNSGRTIAASRAACLAPCFPSSTTTGINSSRRPDTSCCGTR